MNPKIATSHLIVFGVILTGIGLFLAPRAYAHCDTLAGPVVTDAKKAIETNDVGPVLKWVRLQDEEEIRSLFVKTVQARGKGSDVQELVDMHFFETLVRVHRAGEGAPYMGLRPADTPLEPGIEAAEKALESGSEGALVQALQTRLQLRVHESFQRALEARKHKDESVEAGREYVEAYVGYIHYIERVHAAVSGRVTHERGTAADNYPDAEGSAPEGAETHQH